MQGNITKLLITNQADNHLENAVSRLRQFCFLPIDDVPEEMAWGWASYEDFTDTEFTAHPRIGAYLVFSLRIDARRIPPAVLKKEMTVATKAELAKLAEQGKKFMSRERKRELAEEIKLRLLGKVPPVPKQILVAWDVEEKTVFVNTVNEKELILFCSLLHNTFGADAAEKEMDTDRAPSEFLRWLWFNSDHRNGFIPGVCKIESAGKLTLSTEESSVTATDSPEEAKLALSIGKTVRSMSLGIEEGAGVAVVTSCGNIAQVQAAKFPPIDPGEDDQDAVFLSAMYSVEKAFMAVEGAYAHYAAHAEKLEPEIAKWCNG